MGCFARSGGSKRKGQRQKQPQQLTKKSDDRKPSPENLKKNSSLEKEVVKDGSISAQVFSFRELAAATNNFREDCLLGEGGFGRVYRGRLESTNQVVAIKQLDRNGLQGNREFLVEVLMLSLLHHENLVNLIGYCSDGDQRLLVYEYMPLGSLEDHLHDLTSDRKPLDWNTRMQIAAGAAKGLEYLHVKAKPSVIYRDLKCSNILLGEGFHPKLSDFGLAKLGPIGDNTHVSTRVMGTYGYCAPEYAMTGRLTLKSDIYSFGVVLLELITGRRAIDYSRAAGEQNLVAWEIHCVNVYVRVDSTPCIYPPVPVLGLLEMIILYNAESVSSFVCSLFSLLLFTVAAQNFYSEVSLVHCSLALRRCSLKLLLR